MISMEDGGDEPVTREEVVRRLAGPFLPPAGVPGGRSGVETQSSSDRSENDGSGDLRASLAELVSAIRESHEPDGEIVDAFLAAGWAKVPGLRALAETTLDQLARLINAVAGIVMDTPEDRDRHDRLLATFREYEKRARLALRGGEQP